MSAFKVVFLIGVLNISNLFAKEILCENTGEKPQLVVNVGKAKQVVICGFEDKDKKVPGEKKFMSEFQVVLYGNGKVVKRFFEVGANDNYWVSAIANKGLIFEELIFINGNFVPTFKKDLVCDQKDCALGKETCVIEEVGKPKTKVLSKVQQLFDAAISGEKSAQEKFFKQNSGMVLDGEEAENWSAYSGVLRRMKDLGCLR